MRGLQARPQLNDAVPCCANKEKRSNFGFELGSRKRARRSAAQTGSSTASAPAAPAPAAPAATTPAGTGAQPGSTVRQRLTAPSSTTAGTRAQLVDRLGGGKALQHKLHKPLRNRGSTAWTADWRLTGAQAPSAPHQLVSDNEAGTDRRPSAGRPNTPAEVCTTCTTGSAAG